MNIEDYRNHCIAKKGVTESFPFDDRVLVFKVGGKMFALIDIEALDFVNLKCEPELAIELRERYPAVRPGYHMNKQQWNSVYLNEGLPEDLIYEWTDNSYELIFKSLPKKKQAEVLADQK
jgi:predicted DNA-binding protein (MmcQ/YjbR family)